ncbi:RNaseH domain-containing protein [Hymenobacter sp. 5414T-23]|uniref:RNaseH domain-containing protein n=1 Tax=Hymenobacter sp. 5414T-23 TaxID=2932252 RepID=UPI001FD01BDF|nr:RNaseH domain-containing protein [Hymenobacter sp. 5414T-23]UOQ83241.1 RNaseH domain-containing protein [Hymenobacter sp. 5414T-23]
MANYVKWVSEMHENLREHYGGQHQLLLAYQDGLLPDARLAEETIIKVLGADAVAMQMEMLPEGVHGSKWPSNGEKPRPPLQRAEQRLAGWEPWLAEIRQRYQATGRPLPHGVLIIARKKYAGGIDDPISKQVARVALIQGLQGAVVQYLLPITEKNGVAASEKDSQEFQMRLLNAWRDLTLKSVGGMHHLAERLKASMPTVRANGQLPVLLGAGIIRVNKSRSKGNTTSFIPYIVEMDPANGQCQATMLLKKLGPANPARRVPMQPLRAAVRELAAHGPSYLAEKGAAPQVLRERQQLTEQFLYDSLLERSTHYADREVILLADMSTMNSIWTWLADANVNPADMRLHQRTKFQEALPNVTLVRIRPGHAPKALLPTPNVNVVFAQPDGSLSQPRPSATWCDAKLYRLTDTSPGLPTYFSYGSRLFKAVRSLSSYRPTVSIKTAGTKQNAPFTKSWATPNAVEITVMQDPKQVPRFTPDELATLVETLRGAYNHFGGWTTMPGPLHFASFLKEYVPDYELAETEADARQEVENE